MLDHREMRILVSFHLAESSKEKCVPSLRLFEQSEERTSGPRKGLFILGKKKAEKQTDGSTSIVPCGEAT